MQLTTRICKKGLNFINPLTPKGETLGDKKFSNFDSMDRTLNCDHSMESHQAVLYFDTVCFSDLDLSNLV